MTSLTVSPKTWHVIATNLRPWRNRSDGSLSLAPGGDGRIVRRVSYVRDGARVENTHYDTPVGEGWYLGRGIGTPVLLPAARWRVLLQTPEWGVIVVQPSLVSRGGVLMYSRSRRMTVEAREAADRILAAATVTEGLRGGIFDITHTPRLPVSRSRRPERSISAA